jgi:hypothetical protein
MMVLMDLVLLLTLGAAGGSNAEDWLPQAFRLGMGEDPEGLEDLRRRIPGFRDDETEPGAPPQEEGQKQEPPIPAPRDSKQEETPSIDFTWLEIYPRVGMASFSSKYHVNPSACFGVAARAPMPWLSPSSNPNGEYFGLFAELDVSVIKRNIFPKLDKPSGPVLMVGFGVDYTIYRNETWLVMVEAGVHYVNFGGITDLTNGLTPMFGVIGGVSVSRGLSLTLSPEIEYPKTGDYIMMMTLGLVWEF